MTAVRTRAKRPDPKRVEAIFSALRSGNPAPQTELVAHTPFQLLVAVVLSAQMTDAGVNRATASLFQRVKTPADLKLYDEISLGNELKSLNYWRTKTRNVLAIGQILEEKHGGFIPATREELESLPGVGRKTANVVLNVLFGQPTLAVDTHVFRVSHRLGLSVGKTPEDVERDLLQCIPVPFKEHAHHWLILLGRYTCKAQSPQCHTCPVAVWCPSRSTQT